MDTGGTRDVIVAGRDRPAVDVAGRARRGRRPARRRSGAARRASARRRRPASAPRSRRAAVVARVGALYDALIAGRRAPWLTRARCASRSWRAPSIRCTASAASSATSTICSITWRGAASTITLITKPATTPGALGADGRRVGAVRRRRRAGLRLRTVPVRDVPRRRTPRHDGDRSRHGLSGLRLARRARRRDAGRARGEVDSCTRSAPAASATRWPAAGHERTRAVRVQPAGARGVRRHASRLRAAQAARLHAAAGGGAALRAGRRRDPRHGSRARRRRCARTSPSIRRASTWCRTRSIWRRSIAPARPRPPPRRRCGRRLGLAAGERLLLSVGRLEENKGFHVLAAALARADGARRRRRRLALGAGRRRPVSPAHRRRDRRRRARRRASTWPDASAESELAGVVRGRRRVRAPDALRRQLARDARGDGARQAGRRDARRRPARQGAAGRDRLAGRARRRAGARRSARGIARRASRHAGALRRSRAAAGRGGVRLAGRGGAARGALRRAAQPIATPTS